MDNKAKIICVSSVNGGVGKTIFTLNLAGVLENLDKKVLILDFSFYSGGISLALNQNEKLTILDLFNDIKRKNIKDINTYVTKYSEKIDYVASLKNPDDVKKISIKNIETLINNFKNYLFNLADTNLLMMVNDPFNIKNMKTCLTILKKENIYNYQLVLNDAIDYCKNYFTKGQMEEILNNEIKYVLSPLSYVKNIDTLILNGEIITLQKAYKASSDYNIYLQIVTDFLKDLV